MYVSNRFLQTAVDRLNAELPSGGNGPNITLSDIGEWEGCKQPKFGYEKRFVEELPTIDIPRKRCAVEFRRYNNIEVTYETETETKNVLLITRSNQGGCDWVYGTDAMYDAWMLETTKRYQKHDIPYHVLDIREFGNEEAEVFITLVDYMAANIYSGRSSEGYLRVTADQMKYLIERIHATDYNEDRNKNYFPFHLRPPYTETVTLTIADEFRQYAPEELIKAGVRPLALFDALELRRIDYNAIRHAIQEGDARPSTPIPRTTLYTITADCEGRGEGYAFEWSMLAYRDRVTAERDLEKMQELIDTIYAGDATKIADAKVALFEMCPKLKDHKMVDQYLVLSLDTIPLAD